MNPTLDGSGKAIQQKAAEWLALRQARGFTLAEHAAFAEWRGADQRHAAIFAEVEAAWSALNGLSRYPHSADVAADPDLLLVRRPARVLTFRRLGLAAAASLVFTSLVLWKPWDERSHPGSSIITPVDSRIVTLADGSVVELNVGAHVVPAYTPAERHVRLVVGEAHFTVAKNPDRPFIVEANGVAVRAVGTAFDVRIAARSVEVLVTEGIVQVRHPPPPVGTESAPPIVLTAGKCTVVSTEKPVPAVVETVSPPEIDRKLAWQSSRFIFDDLPLSEVVDRFNRSGSKTTLVLADPQLASMKFSGRVRAANVENFVEVLETTFGIAAERRSDGEILLRRAR
jgi:transmembrane sensor